MNLPPGACLPEPESPWAAGYDRKIVRDLERMLSRNIGAKLPAFTSLLETMRHIYDLPNYFWPVASTYGVPVPTPVEAEAIRAKSLMKALYPNGGPSGYARLLGMVEDD